MQRDRLLIAEMIDAATRVVELVGDLSATDLVADDLRREAVLWNLTVMGEAASQISAELKEAHSELTWSDPIRLRDRLVHGYWSIEMEVVVDTASDDLSPLVHQLVAIQESLPDVSVCRRGSARSKPVVGWRSTGGGRDEHILERCRDSPG